MMNHPGAWLWLALLLRFMELFMNTQITKSFQCVQLSVPLMRHSGCGVWPRGVWLVG